MMSFIKLARRRIFPRDGGEDFTLCIVVMISLAVGVNRSFVLRSLVLRSFIVFRIPITYSLAWTRSCALPKLHSYGGEVKDRL